MSELLKNQKFREGLVILLLGIALGVYSLYQFYTAAVKTSWIMSPYLFPLLLSAFTVLVSLSLLLEAVHELRAAAKEDGKIRRKRRHGNRRKGLCAVRRFR